MLLQMRAWMHSLPVVRTRCESLRFLSVPLQAVAAVIGLSSLTVSGALPSVVQGLSATSLAWGAWGGGGMAAADAAVATRLQRLGIASLQPAVGLATLHLAAVASLSTASSSLMTASINWELLLVDGRQRLPFYAEFAPAAHTHNSAALLSDAHVLVTTAQQRRLRGSEKVSLDETTGSQATHPVFSGDRLAFFIEAISAIVARTVGKAVRTDEPLAVAGLDSLGEHTLGLVNGVPAWLT